jgi:hypothetical protein
MVLNFSTWASDFELKEHGGREGVRGKGGSGGSRLHIRYEPTCPRASPTTGLKDWRKISHRIIARYQIPLGSVRSQQWTFQHTDDETNEQFTAKILPLIVNGENFILDNKSSM